MTHNSQLSDQDINAQISQIIRPFAPIRLIGGNWFYVFPQSSPQPIINYIAENERCHIYIKTHQMCISYNLQDAAIVEAFACNAGRYSATNPNLNRAILELVLKLHQIQNQEQLT